MNMEIELKKSYEEPVFAGKYRLFLALLMLVGGLYTALTADFQWQGLGLMLVIGSPFMLFKDEK